MSLNRPLIGGLPMHLGGVYFTPEGRIGYKMINKTGSASVKGSVVHLHTSVDNAFVLAPVDAYDAIGVVYEVGVADGSECLVITYGRCYVLLEDSTASIQDGWVRTSSNTAGRALASGSVPEPPTSAVHFQEIGHCMEAVTAGTGKLALITLHFN